jgi:hypothetical protein
LAFALTSSLNAIDFTFSITALSKAHAHPLPQLVKNCRIDAMATVAA